MADFEIISTIRNFSQVCDYTFTSIPQTYKHLYIIGTGGDSNSNYGATGKWKLLFNGDTGSNWNVSNWASMNQTTNNRQVQVSNEANNYIARTPTQFTFSGDCGFEIWIPNYSSNSSGQPAKCFSLKQFGPMQESSNGDGAVARHMNAVFRPSGWSGMTSGSAAITEVKLSSVNGCFTYGNHISLYGVKG